MQLFESLDHSPAVKCSPVVRIFARREMSSLTRKAVVLTFERKTNLIDGLTQTFPSAGVSFLVESRSGAS
jgi:hypothetical protein